jgi:hypothetical protein
MTDPHYILEYMQDNDLRYFQVANQFNRDVVVSFNDRSLEAVSYTHLRAHETEL